MKQESIEQEKGLGSVLFHFVSTLTPIVNVDLLIFNSKEEILLSRRNVKRDGFGWHIPGSCIRFDENICHAIQRCAEEELNTRVRSSREPIRVYDLHTQHFRSGLDDQRERRNFIALVYACRVPDDYQIDNKEKVEQDAGFLKWFHELSDDFLAIHDCYRKEWIS